MTKKMAQKQKPARIAKPQSQKERLTIASTKAPLGKTVSPRANSGPLQEAQHEKGFSIVGMDQTRMISIKRFRRYMAKAPTER